MEFDPLSNQVIACAIEVHRTLGPGLLESVYRKCLEHELRLAGLRFDVERPVAISYKGMLVDSANLRVDLIVEESLLVELKAVEKLLPVHEAQLLTYMKLSRCKTGLLINFDCRLIKEGLKRLVL
ncbi:MAG: GxxExxY protein [Proteobacteria bacterium]|nr:GxxExxY protein [Pseudomonadota bacterium]